LDPPLGLDRGRPLGRGRGGDDCGGGALRDEAPAEKKAPVADEARVRALIEKLGSAEFGAREKAFEELARIGKAAEPLLREALESEDLQVRKSAEKLLEKLASEEKAPRAEERLAPDRWPERSAEEWLRRMREMGLPIEDEEFERHLEELRERLLRLQRELGAPEIELGPEGQLGERHTILRSDDETIDCRVDSTGKVTVRITKPDADGNPKTEVFEAPDAKAFEKKHPEVWKRVKGFLAGGPRLSIRIGPGGDWPWPGRENPWRRLRPEARPDEGARLGVRIGEISPALRSHLGLEPGEGLLVESVSPGTLAERLGLERHDVVIRIAGTSVGSPEDVREALARVEDGANVEVTVVRRGSRRELQAER
jgi:hypothetical protein